MMAPMKERRVEALCLLLLILAMICEVFACEYVSDRYATSSDDYENRV